MHSPQFLHQFTVHVSSTPQMRQYCMPGPDPHVIPVYFEPNTMVIPLLCHSLEHNNQEVMIQTKQYHSTCTTNLISRKQTKMSALAHAMCRQVPGDIQSI